MFILASQSPQRKAILERLCVSFEVLPSTFDESSITERDPLKRALVLASAKAASISEKYPDRWVIGADTLVVSADHELLEKPVDADDARRMLRLHSGRTSVVHSALALQRGEERKVGLSTASVTFKNLSDAEVEWWIKTNLWQDRSGAFQIEGEGQKLIESYEGEWETIVGFPIQVFLAICKESGISR
ncbi:MAG TPA: Maf family protein [Candidatus Peribacterales bacterium]|uniref:Nucleoside triphosphate pyrophosphatase n=1 Tax=Candidatus Kaiserbacteria bacterium RIFCSPHIGHO2_01_FULL_56_24 TaxID=1798487 RepID=A0A1F6DA07_9BACT|nr:MAG: septum formation protein Maf [Candidatus Kaiserbacteria bacterium RIFCSPHIGHO2_01_FULL_56_24]HLD08301.1 Maf family protein [Candidatus Peribacterales bacterium]